MIPNPVLDLDRRPGLAVRCRDLCVEYVQDGAWIAAVRDANLVIAEGESVAIIGPSGSGKSSLLTTIAGLQPPTSGTVEVLGLRVQQMAGRRVAQLRAQEIGVLLQSPARNLLPLATAMENLLVVQQLVQAPAPRTAQHARAHELLTQVGLDVAATKRVRELSGGEQQRLALAVALANRPRLLLADEPTSQLDRATGRAVALLVQEAHREQGMALLVVTHDQDVAVLLDRTLHLRDGLLTAGAAA